MVRAVAKRIYPVERGDDPDALRAAREDWVFYFQPGSRLPIKASLYNQLPAWRKVANRVIVIAASTICIGTPGSIVYNGAISLFGPMGPCMDSFVVVGLAFIAYSIAAQYIPVPQDNPNYFIVDAQIEPEERRGVGTSTPSTRLEEGSEVSEIREVLFSKETLST